MAGGDDLVYACTHVFLELFERRLYRHDHFARSNFAVIASAIGYFLWCGEDNTPDKHEETRGGMSINARPPTKPFVNFSPEKACRSIGHCTST